MDEAASYYLELAEAAETRMADLTDANMKQVDNSFGHGDDEALYGEAIEALNAFGEGLDTALWPADIQADIDALAWTLHAQTTMLQGLYDDSDVFTYSGLAEEIEEEKVEAAKRATKVREALGLPSTDTF